ncbi:MAG: DNA cytosine methyltransferase [Desulfobacteraceae bacterium]|nr:DNA cytosine methyltransferase [Desulfobacteraceae bacterium]
MKAIDLFCGPGGLSLGLKQSGIVPELCVEFNKDAITTYSSHSSQCIHINRDIREISFSQYKNKIDVVFGGPPCQPFSIGGLRKAKNDERDMIPEFIRCVDEVDPEAFIMENVPGLVSRRARPYFDTVLMSLSRMGYKINWAVLHAADYGVPQKRKRLIVLGCKTEFLRFPFPTHGDLTNIPHEKVAHYLKNEPIGESAKTKVTYAKNPDLRKSPYAGLVYNGGGRPIDKEGLCHTILASSGGSKTHWLDTENVVLDYHQHLLKGGKPRSGFVPGARRLSPEECAIMQTFPEDLVFYGSKSSQYTQIGDAVPPLLSKAIGSAVFSQLNKQAKVESLLEITRSQIIQQCELFV